MVGRAGRRGDHHGEFFDFTGAVCRPQPVQPGGVPIHVGGHSPRRRRAGRLGDGLQPLGMAGEQAAALVRTMREAADAAGRDPDALELTLGHLAGRIDVDKSARLEALGAGRLVLATTPTARPDPGPRRVVRLRREVGPGRIVPQTRKCLPRVSVWPW